MISFIRKYVFAGAAKNALAPYIFVVLCFYAVIISVYTSFFFNSKITIARIIISITIVIVYTVLERSPLVRGILAFLSPSAIMALITFGAVYFRGDFLLFTYNIGSAMISLTYMKSRSLAAYVAVIGLGQAVILTAFKRNLLGPSFTVIYNYLSFIVSIAICILVYIFCKSYTQILSALTEARNEAHQASLAKGMFLSNMSHEIRTPMNAIIGMTTIGKSSNEIEKTHYALEKIEDASEHLLGIINNVLDMSKIESGKFDLSLVQFSFEKMLQRVVNVISFRVEQKKQKFTVHVDEKIPPVLFGDDQRLAQVITNLLGNAGKFTPEEGVISLDVKLLGEENDLCTIQIEVTDSGIGMSPEQQSRLFQPFQQADMNTTREYGGSGLGLAISKKLVEMMGGKIWVRSEPGKGATFAFTVLLTRGELPEHEHAADGTPGKLPAVVQKQTDEDAECIPADYTGRSILLAEDIEINREIMLALLEPLHLTIDCAENGARAVELFTDAPDKYALVFMDLQMPKMDGYEATRRIRAFESKLDEMNAACFDEAETNRSPRRRIPIIAMTANVFREDVEQCLNAGMNDHIGKPLNMDAVFALLKKYLD